MKKLTILLLCLCLLLISCKTNTPVPATTQSTPASEGSPRPEDDFYAYVNSEWLATAEIPAGKAHTGAMAEMQETIITALIADLKNMLADKSAIEDPLERKMIDFYEQLCDYETRNKIGAAPLLPVLAQIETLENLEEFNTAAADMLMNGFVTPLLFVVGADAMQSDIYSLFTSSPVLFLGSRTYYEIAKEQGEKILEYRKDFVLTMFEMAGYDGETALAHWQNAAAFDAVIASVALTDAEEYDPAVTTNYMDFADFAEGIKNVDVQMIADGLFEETPQQIIVANLAFYKAFDTIVSDDTFEQLKSWMLVNALTDYCDALDEAALMAAVTYDMKTNGKTAAKSQDELTYDAVSTHFRDVLGVYYGKTYLGKEGRAAVEKIIRDTVAVFRTRLQENDWLSEATKAQAIVKLDAMTVNVGWPNRTAPHYQACEIVPTEEGGTLFENALALDRASWMCKFSLLGTKVDRELWDLGAHIVNAFYHPSINGIFFPAAILTEPFFSLDQTAAQNYAGIGMVSGHEITHAFDAGGAQYDETGSMNNWWTDEDYAEFEKRTQAMVNLFDGIPYSTFEIDGNLTKGENVADAGGLSCALELNNTLGDGNSRELFEAFARTWTHFATEEYSSAFITDPHSPPLLRVNMQVANLDAFYEAYGITPDDKMYIPPEKRVSIW